jgi:hypothetical protein
MTQQQLADRIGCSLPTMQRLEAGTHPATLKRTWELADAFGLTGAELTALVDGVASLVDAGVVAAWLESLAWLPNPRGPLQRPLLVDELRFPAPALSAAGMPGAAVVDREAALHRRLRAFGLLLGELRARANLPVAFLATLWGPSVSSIKRFENGRGCPDLPQLEALGGLLGLSCTELVALAEGLSLHLGDRLLAAHRRAELLAPVRAWTRENLSWTPNPGPGLLAARPAGYRLEPAVAAARADGLGEVSAALPEMLVLEIDPQPPSSFIERLRTVVLEPAAQALAAPLLRGWGVVGAVLPPITVPKKSLASLIAVELIRVLESRGWRAWPVLLVRPGRARYRSPPKEPSRLVTVTPGEAVLELVRGSLWGGPWRLVLVDGADTLQDAGLGGRQPAPQLQGAALAVLETDLTAGRDDLSQLLGRRVDFACSAVQAMDEELMPGLRFHGVVDPVRRPDLKGFAGWPSPKGEELCDDRRLDALRQAGAFAEGRHSLLHVADEQQALWAQTWLDAQLGGDSARVRVAKRSSAKLRFSGPLDEVVLASSEFPTTAVRQVTAALRRAEVDAGLDVWELQSPDPVGARRRTTLAAALGAEPERASSAEQGEWASPAGRCAFRWTT